MENTANIAQTIFQQLGGNQFVAMTGAKNLAYTKISLSFRLPSKVVNVVNIVLDNDTYTATFYKFRGADGKVVAEHSDVHAEELRNVFTGVTGLELSL